MMELREGIVEGNQQKNPGLLNLASLTDMAITGGKYPDTVHYSTEGPLELGTLFSTKLLDVMK